MNRHERDNKRLNSSDEAIVKSYGPPAILHSDSSERSGWADSLKEIISFSGFLKIHGHDLIRIHTGYVTRCPFHEIGTPMFVSRDESTARCPRCGWSGDLIEYVMRLHDFDFREAFRLLLRDAWLIKRDAKGHIWNAKQVDDYPQVLICRGEDEAMNLVRSDYHVSHNSAVVAVSSLADVAPELSRLLARKEVTLCMDTDCTATAQNLDTLLKFCRCVTLGGVPNV